LLIGGFDFSNFFANGSFRWELGFNGVGGAIAGGFASGGIMGGNIESAVNGAFSAALFYGVGELSGAHEAAAAGRSMTGAEHLAQTFGHAVVGCVSASIAGGSCGSGAASAGFAAAAGPLLPGADISAARFVSRMIVGGVASRLGGGSFESGATSAAFAYLFNDLGKGLSSDAAPSRGLQYARIRAELELVEKLDTKWVDYTEGGHNVRDASGSPMKTREDIWRGRDGNRYVIRDHHLGHAGKFESGPHLNVARQTEAGEVAVGRNNGHYWYQPTHPHLHATFRVNGQTRPSVSLLIERQITIILFPAVDIA
jgi:hypothetical protein